MSKTQHTSTKSKVAALVLFALFIVCLLLVLVAGVKAYSTLATADAVTKTSRFSGGMLENNVRAFDELDAVTSAQGPQGTALVLTQTTPAGAFETRLYQYNGELMQEYVAQEAPFSPELAVPVMRTKTFSFSFENNLLTIVTDEGRTYVAIRSGAGTANGQMRNA